MSAKELKDKLKALRSDFSKPITKMTAEEMAKEIAHHESAKKSAETKAKRLEALAKAREAKKGPPTLVIKEVKKAPVKAVAKPDAKPAPKPRSKKAPAKKADEFSVASSTDHDSESDSGTKAETIKDRIQKK